MEVVIASPVNICCTMRSLIGGIRCIHLIHCTHLLLLNLIVSCILLVFSSVHLCTFVDVFQIIFLFSILPVCPVWFGCSCSLFLRVVLVLCVLFVL